MSSDTPKALSAEERADVEARLWKFISPEPNSGCWLWTGSVGGIGYGRIKVPGKFASAHRVAYEMYVGPIPPGALACHRCDVPSCVNPDHIFLGSDADNMADCLSKGRQYWQRDPTWKRGGNNPGAKLTEGDVIEMRRVYQSSRVPMRVLAQRFGVSETAVRAAIRGTRWAWLTTSPAAGIRENRTPRVCPKCKTLVRGDDRHACAPEGSPDDPLTFNGADGVRSVARVVADPGYHDLPAPEGESAADA